MVVGGRGVVVGVPGRVVGVRGRVVGVVVVGAAVVGGWGSTVRTSRVAGVRSTGGPALIVAAGADGIDAAAGLRGREALVRGRGVSTGAAATVGGSPPVPRNGPNAVCARRRGPFPSATAIRASATTSAQTETTNVTTRRRRRSNSPWSTAALRLPAREANLVPRPVSAPAPTTLSGIGRFSGCCRTKSEGPSPQAGRYCSTGESASTRPMRSNSGVADPSENS
ncbi:MAG: hypothetical protein QOG65_2112 [Actinomycetota bacterium]|nr:hypothetical protein [Actinomycetota bacterium]